MTSLEQQFQQMTETNNKMPGYFQWMAYILLTATLILVIMGLRKTYRYWLKLDESERHYAGWGALFYGCAFISMFFWYLAQSMSNITAMVK